MSEYYVKNSKSSLVVKRGYDQETSISRPLSGCIGIDDSANAEQKTDAWVRTRAAHQERLRRFATD